MTPDQIEHTAQALFAAERDGVQIGIPSIAYPEMGMAEAYGVQAQLIAAKVAAGGVRKGWKIGLTSRAMQAALNIDVPDSGILFEDMFFAHDGSVPRGRFIEPRVEAEIAFVMRDDLQGAVDREAVLATTDHVCASLEILDTRIVRKDDKTGQARKVFDTIADNAANAGIVLGRARHDPNAVDLRRVGAIVSRDGVVEETGMGAGVLNDPVMGIVWLVERLAQYGEGLTAGDVVLAGSFIRPIEAPEGSRFEADFGDFGQVNINF